MVHHKQMRSLKALTATNHTMEAAPFLAPPPPPSAMAPMETQGDPDEMNRIFYLCRNNNWEAVFVAVTAKPSLAMTPIIMDNHISTTILHQAITSKGNTMTRAKVIRQVLGATPRAASLRNGYGSLPLHVITQRNTKIKSNIKEGLIQDFVMAYSDALFEEGGTGRRTPLHIIFTDYISPGLTKLMIERGARACFMKDKKGWLPAHVAASRHVSPEKLRMLLEVNPSALYEKTNNGETLLDLAKTTATKSHPNYALIEELNRHLNAAFHAHAPVPMEPHPSAVAPTSHIVLPPAFASPSTPAVLSEESDGSTRGRLDSADSAKAWAEHWGQNDHHIKQEVGTASQGKMPGTSRKRKLNENNATEALLLLKGDKHFQDYLDEEDDEEGNEGRPMQIARV